MKQFPTVSNAVPWLPYEAIIWLMQKRKEWDGEKCFEWGSGCSTLFFSQMFSHIYSVEHDQAWYIIVNNAIKKSNVKNVDLQLIKNNNLNGCKRDHADPESFMSGNGNCYLDYVCEIRKYQDNAFKLILIDGRARPSCLLQAMKKVKRGGYIMLDNAENKKYHKAIKLMPKDKFDCLVFSGVGRNDPSVIGSTKSWKTVVWRKR